VTARSLSVCLQRRPDRAARDGFVASERLMPGAAGATAPSPAQTEPCRWRAHCEPVLRAELRPTCLRSLTASAPAYPIGPALVLPVATVHGDATATSPRMQAIRPQTQAGATAPAAACARPTATRAGPCAKAGGCLSTSGESEGASARANRVPRLDNSASALGVPSTPKPAGDILRHASPVRVTATLNWRRRRSLMPQAPSGLRRLLYPPDVDRGIVAASRYHPCAWKSPSLATRT
jgi:hypothetical protein